MTTADRPDASSLLAEMERRPGHGRPPSSVIARLDEMFYAGRAPDPLPDGFMRGRFLVPSSWEPADLIVRRVVPLGLWEGKRFDRAAGRGVNVLRVPHTGVTSSSSIERYPFETRVAPAATNPDVAVLAIDYDVGANPRWVRPVLDEVVEIEPGSLLGKVHLRRRSRAYAVGFFALGA
ncbi:hypothetical protein BH24ACT26_BH24ACT26_03550 [soil metagenome]